VIGECYTLDVTGSTWAIMCTQYSRDRSPHTILFALLIRTREGALPNFALEDFDTFCRLTTIHDRTDLLARQPNLPIVWSRISAAKELYTNLQYVSSRFSITNEFHIGFFHIFILAKDWRKIAGSFKSLGKQSVFEDVLSSGCSGVKVETASGIANVFENIENYTTNFGLMPVPLSIFRSE
jgi:hypothetical protein